MYPVVEMLELKRRIPIWTAQLRNEGFDVQRISLSEILWQLVDESGRGIVKVNRLEPGRKAS